MELGKENQFVLIRLAKPAPVSFFRNTWEVELLFRRNQKACEKLQSWLERFAYKPTFSWAWTIQEEFYCLQFLIVITHQTWDSRDCTKRIETKQSVILMLRTFEEMSFEHFVRFFQHCLNKAEDHEFNEFFTVDEQKPYDPHREGTK